MRISNLSNKSGNPSASDYLVLDDGTTVTKIDYNKLAKAIIENYAGSNIAGSVQTLKAALDSLNSKSLRYVRSITSADDCDELTQGVYIYTTSVPANAPTDAPTYGTLIVLEENYVGTQVYKFQLLSTSGRGLYYRRKQGTQTDGFSAWTKVTGTQV